MYQGYCNSESLYFMFLFLTVLLLSPKCLNLVGKSVFIQSLNNVEMVIAPSVEIRLMTPMRSAEWSQAELTEQSNTCSFDASKAPCLI